ncbi:Mitochondrial amidoxime reducing component 2, partial [Nymphaea thermarum]
NTNFHFHAGLLHDREWCLQSPSGEVLTQKKVPRMSLVGPLIDRTRGLLTVESPYCSEKLQIGLDISCKYLTRQKMNLHAQRYEFQVYNDEINQWFSEAIGCPCTLVRCCSSEVLPCTNGRTASTCRDTDSKLNFVNEAQFLLVTEESVDDLNRRLKPNCERYESDTLLLPIDPIRFRPNLVIGGAEPYEEDDWKAIHIDKEHFSATAARDNLFGQVYVRKQKVAVEDVEEVAVEDVEDVDRTNPSPVIGGCNRCQMINRNPKSISMQVSKEPLATLSSYRRVKDKENLVKATFICRSLGFSISVPSALLQ